MKSDGLTLLDDTSVESQQTEKYGDSFPINPAHGDVWELKKSQGEYQKGVYVFADGKWLAVSGVSKYPHDIGLSHFGDVPINRDIARFLCNRTMYLKAHLKDSIACSLLNDSSTPSELDVVVVRKTDGSELKVATINFKAKESDGVFNNTLDLDVYLDVGDLLTVRPTMVGVGLKDLCITLAGHLVK